MKKLFGWAVIGMMLVAFPVSGICAGKALTFDCTPAIDEITSAKIQFNMATPIDVSLVSTCGSGTDKVTCTDPKSKTICFPDSLWPTGAFTAKATVSNVRTTSEPSSPLNVPGIPTSPGLLKVIQQ